MDWFHCNRCALQPGDSNARGVTFGVASCGHIYCGPCIQSMKSISRSIACPMCHAKHIRLTPLTSTTKLSPEMIAMFRAPNDAIKEVYNCYEYQIGQMRHADSMLRKKNKWAVEQIDRLKHAGGALKQKLDKITKQLYYSRDHQREIARSAQGESLTFGGGAIKETNNDVNMARPVSPTFSSMPINAFMPHKTPHALKFATKSDQMQAKLDLECTQPAEMVMHYEHDVQYNQPDVRRDLDFAGDARLRAHRRSTSDTASRRSGEVISSFPFEW